MVAARETSLQELLEGSKQFVQNAGIADKYLVPAITSDTGRPEESITLFLVDARSPGISQTHLDTVSGDSQYEVVFDNVRASVNSIIGEANTGWAQLARSLQIAAVMSSAQMLGAGQELLELTVEDAEARRQFDAGSVDEYTDEHIASLRHDVDKLREVVYRAAGQLEAGEPCDFESTVVNSWMEFAEKNA